MIVLAKRWDEQLLAIEGHLTKATRGSCSRCGANVVLSLNSAKRVQAGATVVCNECVLGARPDGVPRGYSHAEKGEA